MSSKIFESKSSIVFENDYTAISISKKDSFVESVIDKKTGGNIKGEDSHFFGFFTKDEEKINIEGVSLKDDVLTVVIEGGKAEVKALAFDSYFTFEVISNLPKNVYKAHLIDIKYDYDFSDKKNTGAIDIAMSIWADPSFFPHAKELKTLCRVFPHLGDKGAKIGLVIAPIIEHRDIIKALSLTIDRKVGIVSKAGGAWCRDFKINLCNYSIQHGSTKEFIESNMEYYKNASIKQLDLYFGGGAFTKGDFCMTKHKDAADYRANVTDILKANGMTAGLHTFATYVDRNSVEFLSDPKWRDQIRILKTYTLDEDITDDSEYVKLVEGKYAEQNNKNADVPLLLIDDELIYFEDRYGDLKIVTRGHAGTTKSDHKKGSVVKHLESHYWALAPICGSELFYEIARRHAKTCNECGFNMVYLDALSGIGAHCGKDEAWFYMAAFVHEILINCDEDIIIDGANWCPAIWASIGRVNAYDTFNRNYKNVNRGHALGAKRYLDCYLTSTLGWYEFYPVLDEAPGNEQVKYHHTDDVHFLGSLATMYGIPNVINGTKDKYERYAGLRRNLSIYKKYDDLRQSEFFAPEYLEKIQNGKWEYELREKRGGKFCFVEKDYQYARLHDLSDEDRNYAEYKNPFGAQLPFIRIEAFLSSKKKDAMVMMRFDENVDLVKQTLHVSYGMPVDFSKHIAKNVRIKGNGIKGGKIGIQIMSNVSESPYALYVIDTDFEGWREFTLIECENGERNDHEFEKDFHILRISRSTLNSAQVHEIQIFTEGDMTGVRMSDILAYEHSYEILKNPTVQVRDTSIMFECELMSSDFIEFDGKTAKVVDRYGNEKEIFFKSEGFKVPRGRFEATLTAKALNRGVPRAKLTFGFTGKEVK